MTVTLLLVAMAVALCVAAFFSAAETAMFLLGPADVEALTGGSPVVRRAVEAVLGGRRRLLMTVLLCNLAANVFQFTCATHLGHALAGGDRWITAGIDGLVVVVVIIGAEIIPKVIATRAPRRVAALAAIPLLFAERVMAIPRGALRVVSNAVMRLIPGRGREEGDLTPLELQQILALSAEKGQLAYDEHEWLRALLELDHVRITEVMVPRVDVVTFDLREGREALLKLHRRTRRNKIPVHESDVDHLAGFVNVKDVVAEPDRAVRALVQPALFIPETATVADALATLRARADVLAIVVDEYGGTEGIVTREDLVEAMVGDIADESEERWDPVRPAGHGAFLVDALLPLHVSQRVFGLPRVTANVATLGGLVMSRLARVAAVGDEITIGDVRVRVVSLAGRRPDQLEVVLLAGAKPKGVA